MKVTVCFGPVSVVVPCGNGDNLVRDLISQAVTRYRKASNKSNDAAISVVALHSSNDAILDPDDRLADVVDDREHLTARLSNVDEGDGNGLINLRGERTSASSNSGSPLIEHHHFQKETLKNETQNTERNTFPINEVKKSVQPIKPLPIEAVLTRPVLPISSVPLHEMPSIEFHHKQDKSNNQQQQSAEEYEEEEEDGELTESKERRQQPHNHHHADLAKDNHIQLQDRYGLEPDLNRFSTDAPITIGSSSSTSHNQNHADLPPTTTSNSRDYKIWSVASILDLNEVQPVVEEAINEEEPVEKESAPPKRGLIGATVDIPPQSEPEIQTEIILPIVALPLPSAETEVPEKGPSEESSSKLENLSIKSISTPKHGCRATTALKIKKRKAIQLVSYGDQAISEAENHPLRSKRRKDDQLNDPKLSMSTVVRLHKINVASGLAQEVALVEKKRISTSSNEEVTSAKVKPVRRGRGRQPKEIYKSILSTNIDLRMKIIKSDSKKKQDSDKQKQQQCGHGQKKESAPLKHDLRGDTVAIPPHFEADLQSEIIEPCQPYTASNVIDHLKVGSTVIFTVITSEKKLEFRGPIILPDSANDEIILADFNSFAETIVAPPNFRPIIGTIVAALSSSQSNWMRGYITKVLESSYHVYFVDYGNSDYSVVAVKPIPVSYQHETMSVRLSFFGYLTCASKDFIKKSMVEWKSYQLVITKKKADGSFLAKFTGENVPNCFVKIESWEKTLTETNVSPASVKLAVETTSEPVPMAPGLVRSIRNAAITDIDSSNDNLASKDEGYSTMSSDDQLDSSCSSLSLFIASSCSFPATLTFVSEAVCPEMCGMTLDCGHTCPLPCHKKSSHEKIQCPQPCQRTCPEQHPCKKKCFEDCGKCFTPMKKLLPCGHEGEVNCSQNLADVDCTLKVIKVLTNCEHSVEIECGKSTEGYKCKNPCEKLLCEEGHSCKKKCFEPCGLCSVRMKREFKCGHTTTMECFVDPSNVKCRVPKECILPLCGHQATIPCGQDPTEGKCSLPCDVRLDCGHTCTLKCHVQKDPDHENYQCKKECGRMKQGCKKEHRCWKKCFEECILCNEKWKRTLPCGHDIFTECHRNDNDIFCSKSMMKTIPECEHQVELACSTEPVRALCKEMCASILPCGHLCKKKCCEPCDQAECEEPLTTTKVNICGHHVTLSCKNFHEVNGIPMENQIQTNLETCLEPCKATLDCEHLCKETCECFNGRVHSACAECNQLVDDDDGDVIVHQSEDNEDDQEDQAELIPSLPPSPFSCNFCKRLFKYKRSRDRHEKIHTGDKQHRCKHCDAAFARRDHLQIHNMSHDTSMPFKCSICQRGYSTTVALTTHMLYHRPRQSTPQLEPEISVEPEQFVEIFVEIIAEESSEKLAVETTSEPVPMESEPATIPPQSEPEIQLEIMEFVEAPPLPSAEKKVPEEEPSEESSSNIEEVSLKNICTPKRCRQAAAVKKRKAIRSIQRKRQINCDTLKEKCDKCKFTCQFKSELDRHKGYKHKNKIKFKCDTCGRKFVEKNKLRLHIKKKHL